GRGHTLYSACSGRSRRSGSSLWLPVHLWLGLGRPPPAFGSCRGGCYLGVDGWFARRGARTCFVPAGRSLGCLSYHLARTPSPARWRLLYRGGRSAGAVAVTTLFLGLQTHRFSVPNIWAPTVIGLVMLSSRFLARVRPGN